MFIIYTAGVFIAVQRSPRGKRITEGVMVGDKGLAPLHIRLRNIDKLDKYTHSLNTDQYCQYIIIVATYRYDINLYCFTTYLRMR